MKKLLIAAAAATSLVALNTAVFAGGSGGTNCCGDIYKGAINLGAIEQGDGINAAILNQVAANKGRVTFETKETFQEDLDEMIDFEQSVSLIVGKDINAVSAGDDIKDEFVFAGDDIKRNDDVLQD